ncbi:MAG TPA: DNA repair protein RecO C-terminal domain-containing protein, partial [Allosphingosinicella sp.]|nr:DNA repair protein RecO C-terminal domain-containing protein [Allosphingosinicella sp.]
PYPRLFQALDGLLVAIEASPSARSWAPSLVRYELFVLAELGFGLDLSECAATGATGDLAFVSPKSGRAVSASAAGEYSDRLFPLPPLLLEPGAAGWPDILAGLRITGHFLARDVLIERQSEILAARERLIDRLKRAGG